jgi:bacillithiol biosynthesis cysteine-adding enzyme BshC
MTIDKISFSETHSFSRIFLDYIHSKESLKPFYGNSPDVAGFEQQIKEKATFPQPQRQLLHNVLMRQYKDLAYPDAVKTNIDRLADDKAFTVTTGHQLNIFTGPLYFIYKIVTTINTCKRLQETYPDYHFVPVYWMASEDHDFEEISHFHLFGQDYVWETDQQGAVGRFKTDDMGPLLESLPEKVALFEKAYREQSTLADAVRYYVNGLFGEEGLIVLDADDAELKAGFRPVTLDDLQQHTAKKLVSKASEALEKEGYKGQVFPREINFFYLDDQLRERIELQDGKYRVLNTGITFSPEELAEAIEKQPGKFSPNVIMRPLYQEMILPNLAYIGGPSELAYWLQLKPVFEHYEVSFPILMPRNFGLVINKSNGRKLEKLPIQAKELFLDTQTLIAQFVEANADGSITLSAEEKTLAEVFDKVREKAAQVDKSLEGFIGKQEKTAMKSLQNIEKRLKKSEEQNQETHVKQLESLKDKLFPGGTLQERKENFLNFQINNPRFLAELLEYLDPFDYRFNILNESDDY